MEVSPTKDESTYGRLPRIMNDDSNQPAGPKYGENPLPVYRKLLQKQDVRRLHPALYGDGIEVAKQLRKGYGQREDSCS
jgi:hypothetical protein